MRSYQLITTSLFTICLALAHASSVRAQSPDQLPLLVEVDAASYYTRTGGPTQLVLNVTSGSGSVLKGQLTLQIANGRDLLGTFENSDLFITPGEQTMQMLIPPLAEDPVNGFLEVAVWFTRDDGKTYRLPNQQLRMTATDGRRFVLTKVQPEVEILQQNREFAEGLDFDAFRPPVKKMDPSTGQEEAVRLQPLTLARRVAAEDLPTLPIEHCASDIVAINGTGFATLKPAQLNALIGWIRAGGSLYVELNDTIQPAEQVQFLNQLMEPHVVEVAFLPSSLGPPTLAAQGEVDDYLLCKFGLGRVAVVPGGTELPESDMVRAVAPFLWKVRLDQVQAIGLDGEWSFQVARDALRANESWNYSYQADPSTYEGQMLYGNMNPVPVGGGIGLVKQLMPRGFELVPLWLIASVLCVFIVVVGPLDYFFVGLFTSRKWTWISFPTATLLFTGLAVFISNWYMNTGDHRGHLIIRDVVDGGLIARESELQLLFNSFSTVAKTNAEQELFTPLVYQRFTSEADSWELQVNQRRMQNAGTVGKPVFNGQLPQYSTVSQSVPQWTPQLNRLSRIPNKDVREPSGFDWNTPIGWQDTADLQNRVRKAFGPSARAQLFRTQPGNDYAKYLKKVIQGGDQLLDVASNNELQTTYTTVAYPQGNTTREFLETISMRESRGLFGVVSQVSPTGGDQFEDLTLMDSSNPFQVLLIVVVTNPDNSQTVFRRVYNQ
ncbi:MAG: hypothetical protein KDA66_03390 [Planctomycetaceae bacterium]|nr:hypothetical protein [Planctomycetaceae bacterium]